MHAAKCGGQAFRESVSGAGPKLKGGKEPAHRPARNRLEDALGPVFERVLHLAHELMGDGTVYDSVIVRQR